MRLFFMLLMMIGLCVTTPAHAAPVRVEDIEAYLNNITQLQANFTQNDQDGLQRKGVFYLNRPGRLRFEYYPMPGQDLNDFIVADGRFVYYYDSEMEEQTNAPIGQTLADLILRPNLSFKKSLDVTSFTQNANSATLSLRQKNEPEAGQIQFIFGTNPLSLQSWTVTDATGYKTTITLSGQKIPQNLDANLFVYKDPKKSLKKPKGFELNE